MTAVNKSRGPLVRILNGQAPLTQNGGRPLNAPRLVVVLHGASLVVPSVAKEGSVARRRSRRIGGRHSATSTIQDWLTSPDETLLLVGGAGTGKSALVTRLAQAQGPTSIHATHFCRADAPKSVDPIRVLASIGEQLSRTIPGYAELLRPSWPAQHDNGLAPDAVLDSFDARGAFHTTLRTPLETLRRRGRLPGNVVVIVDGLDEAEPGGGAALIDLFTMGRNGQPPGLKFLLTMRPGRLADGLAPVATVDLSRDGPADLDDMGEYLATIPYLAGSERRNIAAGSCGSYVYVDLATRLRRAGDTGLFRGTPPDGLAALYHFLLYEREKLTSFDRTVLCLLGRGRDRGFTVSEVAALLDASVAESDEAILRLGILLTGTNQLRPHHRCLAEHVVSTRRDGIDPAEFDWRISQAIIRRWAPRWPACGESYPLRHVLTHLADVVAGTDQRGRQQVAVTAIEATVANPGFVTQALARIGVDDALTAMAYVRRQLPGLVGQVNTTARLLRVQAPALRQARQTGDTVLGAQQLLFAASGAGEADLGRALVGRVSGGLLTLWATTDSHVLYAPNARRGHSREVTDISMPSTGTQAITSSPDGTALIWRLASGQLAQSLNAGPNLAGVVAAPDASQVVAFKADGRVGLMDVDSGETVRDATGPTVAVTAFAVNADGSCAVSGDLDGNATIWDLTSGEPLGRLPGDRAVITAVAISADGLTVALGYLGGGVTMWDVPTRNLGASMKHAGRVTALALTPHADHVIVGGECSLSAYPLPPARPAKPIARLFTRSRVSAVAVNPVMPRYVLFGTALGQVAYVRLP